MNSIAYARKQMIAELNYEGNIGLMEISQFYINAKKTMTTLSSKR